MPGDRVRIFGPRGRFFPEEDAPGVLVAGGIGRGPAPTQPGRPETQWPRFGAPNERLRLEVFKNYGEP